MSNRNRFPETCESFPQNQYLYVYALLFFKYRRICMVIYIYVEHVYLIIVKESDTYSIVKYKCILHPIYILCKIVVIKPDTLSFALLTNVFLIVECICCLPYESAFSVAFRSGLENFTFWFETFEYVRIFPFFCNRKARKARRARRARRARKARKSR